VEWINLGASWIYLIVSISTTSIHRLKMENGTPSDGKDPSAFLSEIIGAPVTVKLNSGVVYKGELQSVDGYMNIALEKTEEYVNGALRKTFGDAFVRGNNVLYISAQ
jgi:U6 snRNA-associated Sm-like protein LSm6